MSEAADKLKNKLATYEGLFDISDTYSGGKREMKIRLNQTVAPSVSHRRILADKSDRHTTERKFKEFKGKGMR